jgi:cytochrome c
MAMRVMMVAVLAGPVLIGGGLAVAAPVNGAGGNAARGEMLYEDKCTGCHSLDANRVGPAHRGVYGRKAGLAKGFAYSPAVKASRIIWTEPTLDRWLTNPQGFIQGARMGFRLDDPAQRADVIAYLRKTSGR